jgi:hypothetical protein
MSLELLLFKLEVISYLVLAFYEISSYFFLNSLNALSLAKTATEAPWLSPFTRPKLL